MTGKDLCGAAIAIYGSRTSILIYNTQNNKIEELTLLRMGKNERWIVTNPDMKIKEDAKLFSPATRAAYEHPKYLELFETYCKKGISIRYSGCFAVDCYQMFIKGHGVYTLLDSVAHPSRLSLIYRIIPVAFLVEKAGGKTSDTHQSCLDIVIEGF